MLIVSALPSKKGMRLPDHLFFRSCSNHAPAEQEHRLGHVLLEAGPQVRKELPHCGEEPLDADLRPWEHSELKVTGPHRSGVAWVLVLVALFIDAS